MGILTKSLGAILYVQIAPDCLTVRNPKSGKTFSEPPELAIAHSAKTQKIVAVGAAARQCAGQPTVEVVNPFAHPRSLVSDFTAGEQLLKAVVSRLTCRSVFALAPRVVLHPLGDPAGGFTQVEIRALREMAIGAGARQVRIWQGRALTDQELMSGTFPAGGKLLL